MHAWKGARCTDDADFPVKESWITALYSAGKMTGEKAKEQYVLGVSGAKRHCETQSISSRVSARCKPSSRCGKLTLPRGAMSSCCKVFDSFLSVFAQRNAA